ncbi:hypothetical protein H5410_030424 [Solanum commersonii]|uniref:Polyprotein protein n=1 Tax=Solanum commersonii TaxID=4109 RepID=A0A9J5YJA6_SOLCO|nr:hypothetical protein H5410_030424 [Solanum commersonii]
MSFEMVEIPHVPDIPPTTTGDEVRVDEAADIESEVETDDEIMGVAEEVSYEGLTKTEEAMINAVVQTSLANTPLDDPNAAIVPSEVTPSIDAQVQIDAPGTDAPTDGVTK